MFKIGHPAYQGANELAFASSKSKAVEILRERGMTRDAARALIDFVIVGNGYATASVTCGLVEVQRMYNLPPCKQHDLERQILNRNPNLALDLFHQHKQHHGYAPYRDTLVRNLLLVKQGVMLPPPPREVRI